MGKTASGANWADSAVAQSGEHEPRSLPMPWGVELPLVGRRSDLSALRQALDDAVESKGQTIVLLGDGGVGKSRLVQALAHEVAGDDVTVAIGRGYAVESSFPYGAIGDALVPSLCKLDPAALAVLARGVEGELRAVLPGLPGARDAASAPIRDPDLKARLLWNFAQFLTRFAQKRPLLLVFENAQWCDPSSIELLHFVARQISAARVLIVVTHTSDDRDVTSAFRGVERSLVATNFATVRRIEPLTRHDMSELMQRAFGQSTPELERVASHLFEQTRGNPFFVEEMLKSHVSSGRLKTIDGRWVGWDASRVVVPATVRDVVQERLAVISDAARQVAAVAAVIGTRASLQVLGRVTGLDAMHLADAIDELLARRLLVEFSDELQPSYEFAHPIVQSTVLGTLSAARARAMHLRIANEMKLEYGDAALEHALEIAVHLERGGATESDHRALQFFARAGREAMAKRADLEAVRWLSTALTIVDASPAPAVDDESRGELMEQLAVAKQRVGDREGASSLLERALHLAMEAGDSLAQSRLLRRKGLASVWAGQTAEGVGFLDRAEAAANAAARIDLAIRVRVTKGLILQSLGRGAEGTRTLLDILPVAEDLGSPAVLARVHRALLQLLVWTGPAEDARTHGAAALTYARTSGDRSVAWSAHWSLAILEGFSGNAAGFQSHRLEAERLAEELRSPLLQAWSAEIAIEYASSVGEWGEGMAKSEWAIGVARAIAPVTLLPRLLVWTGLIVLARLEEERALALFSEAWELSCADDAAAAMLRGELPGTGDVHNVIVAHMGMATYHLALGNWRKALTLGQQGLALADRYGCVVWGIHRLLPIIGEAGLWLQDFDVVERMATRLREQSPYLDHRLGSAWATTAEALVMRLKHGSPHAATALIEAAEGLEAVPLPFFGARVRRNASQCLAADGDVEGAVRELRRAHDVFARLGAERELRGARSDLRALGVRLPPRAAMVGVGALTGRELEIARLVAKRLSNKEIARDLEISARTVSTHLSNVFEKLGVDSRGALVDTVRDLL